MKKGRVDCICGDQIISNSGKTMAWGEDLRMVGCWGCGKLYNYDLVESFRVEGEAVTYQMKIFRMNDYDWWMDIGLESAKKNYMEHTENDDESDCIDKARELTEEELDSSRFYKDGDCRDDENGDPKCSFRERMNELDQIPQFFASTEY